MTNPNNYNSEARTIRILQSYEAMGLIGLAEALKLAPAIKSDMDDLLNAVGNIKIEPYVPVSVIAPGITLLELIQAYEPRIKDYAKDFEPKKAEAWHSPYSFVFDNLWSQYEDGEIIPLGNSTTMVSAALIEGSSDGDGFFRPAAEAAKVSFGNDIVTELLDPAAYIALSAIRRLEGGPAFGGFTVIPQLSIKEVGDNRVAPYIVSRQGDLILGSRDIDSPVRDRVDFGVRFSLSLLTALDAPTDQTEQAAA